MENKKLKTAVIKKIKEPLINSEEKPSLLNGIARKLKNGNTVGVFKTEDGVLIVFQNIECDTDTSITLSKQASAVLASLLWQIDLKEGF